MVSDVESAAKTLERLCRTLMNNARQWNVAQRLRDLIEQVEEFRLSNDPE